jgi:ADP-ribose pyrophosphatase YjhB (NUDIX family)
MTMTTTGPRIRAIPEGDDRERLTCPDCGYIAYENPKVVAGAVVAVEGRILMCKRAIEPRKGFWTEEGARREAWEEARARIAINALLGVYSVPRISQVQLIYRATLAEPGYAAGPESEAVDLFAWDDILWDDLAFPSVRWALDDYRAQIGRDVFAPAVNPAGMTGDRF